MDENEFLKNEFIKASSRANHFYKIAEYQAEQIKILKEENDKLNKIVINQLCLNCNVSIEQILGEKE